MMNIAVIGTGYVGLVTGTCFAETGNQVICVDIDEQKVQAMQNGSIPIYEPGLEVIFQRNIEQGRLKFTTDLSIAVEHASIIFLALPTPPDEDGSADLSHVLKAAGDIAELIKEYKIIVNKSTVPVGTAAKVTEVITAKTNVSFDVVSNPEFLREGFAVEDFMKPDRVVIGTSSAKAKEVMGQLYKAFVRQGNPILFMDEKSSELTKYASNAFLASKISFMNEVANFCEKVGANVDQVRVGMGADERIGKRFLFAGIGYGGSCFPKDVKALAHAGNANNNTFQILDAVMQVNESQKTILAEKLNHYFDGNLEGKTIAVWGLAFKPNTDDIREAPSLYIIRQLLQQGAIIKAFDPEAMDNIRKSVGDEIQYGSNQYEVLEGADALLILTEWSVFRSPDFEKMQSLMNQKVIFDGRNLYELAQMKTLGYYYNSIGRALITQ